MLCSYGAQTRSLNSWGVGDSLIRRNTGRSGLQRQIAASATAHLAHEQFLG